MAQKKDNLDEKLLETLRELQNKANQSIVNLGEASIRLRDVESELNRLKELKETLLKDYDQSTKSIQAELQNLQKTYPTGEIDLIEGVVVYESE